VVPPGSTAVVALPLVLAVPVPRQQGGGSGGCMWQLVPVVQTAAGRPFNAVLLAGTWPFPAGSQPADGVRAECSTASP
jgi:hypothetical protein